MMQETLPQLNPTPGAGHSDANAAAEPLVRIEGLTIGFPDETGERFVPVVEDAGFVVHRNEILGLVGESGSGKTQTSMAILGLTRRPGKVMAGHVIVDGVDVVGLDEAGLRRVRGRKAAMIFQSPRTSLNPLMTVGDQVARVYVRQRGMNRRAARAEALAMLRRVGIAGAERVAGSYPHQLSGGMAQRVMIGMMVACGPDLLIADEPTTGLDVTIQAQIFELIQQVQAEARMSVLLITHDLGVVAETCHRVAVMQGGRVVEIAPVEELFARPRHPYTVRLLGAMLRPDRPSGDTQEPDPLPERLDIEVGGRRYEAVSVDAWAAAGVGLPMTIEVAPGHFVLCHEREDGADAAETER
ncbi:MAG: ABC transporter ATP-binding protein [Thermomicrobiales bacterium]|nr:ABC transporter ATP-binding protein [Thermomicrobiales bacterium]